MYLCFSTLADPGVVAKLIEQVQRRSSFSFLVRTASSPKHSVNLKLFMMASSRSEFCERKPEVSRKTISSISANLDRLRHFREFLVKDSQISMHNSL